MEQIDNENLKLYLYFKFFKLIIRAELVRAKVKEFFKGKSSNAI